MADTPETGAAAGTEEQKQPVKMQTLTQYVRDMSFENIVAQKGIEGDPKPEIQVQVNLDARKRKTEHQYEVIATLKIESKTKDGGSPLFLLELEYGGIFHIENVPNEQMHPFLLIECPRILFPFIRRIVHDVTRDGGFPPLNLENIDFVQLYRSELTRRAEAEKANQPIS